MFLKYTQLKEEKNDVNINLGFGTNIQSIFFNVIKKVIYNYYKYIEFSENEYFPFYGGRLEINFKGEKFMENLSNEFIINPNGFLLNLQWKHAS